MSCGRRLGAVGVTIVAIVLAVACSSSSSSGGSNDAGGTGSVCGNPGDMGNALGVGQYCTKQGTCPATAPICSTIENPDQPADKQTFICIATCSPCSPPGTCGTGASCVCNSKGCGCVPDTCSVLGTPAGPCTDSGVDGDVGEGG